MLLLALLIAGLAAFCTSSMTVHALSNRTMSLHTPQSSTFDVNLALLSVELSAAAYCSSDQIQDWTCKPCIGTQIRLDVKSILYSSVTDTHGYIGIHNDSKTVVVAFQGTHDIKQWIDDLSFFKTDLNYPGASSDVKVHGGFYKAYQEVKDTVDSVVNQSLADYPGYSVHVTGHSLGAAIAVMCSLDLAIKHPHITVTHYTFGQPRVGNAEFAKFYNESTVTAHYRTVHYEDIVPHLPLEAMGFAHTPTEVFYPEKYTGPSCLHVCDGSGEDPKCSDGNWVDLSVSDHLNYLNRELDTGACH